MSIIIAGHLLVDPAKRDEALQQTIEGMTATHAENGCVAYAFSADLIDPGKILLFEKWESAEALASHAKSQHLAEMQGKMGGWGITGVEILKYEIASEGPLR
ncbi:MAG TPA: putative quinol monooxygenase [Acidimicrobiales bacterium]|nr:putative quinol monooxygenase [Acidimicrobiales bacterium]